MTNVNKFDRVLMGVAKLWSSMATCSRLSVGCVVADQQGKILGSGYNGTPSGQLHCQHICTCYWGPDDHEPWCGAVQGCTQAVHAETNAIAFAKQSVAGSTLYCTHSPCHHCTNLILAAGIKRVLYSESYRDTSALETLSIAGVLVEQYKEGLYV